MNTVKLVKGWDEMGSNVQMLSSSPGNFLEQYSRKNELTNDDRELKGSPVELISSIRIKKGWNINIFIQSSLSLRNISFIFRIIQRGWSTAVSLWASSKRACMQPSETWKCWRLFAFDGKWDGVMMLRVIFRKGYASSLNDFIHLFASIRPMSICLVSTCLILVFPIPANHEKSQTKSYSPFR